MSSIIIIGGGPAGCMAAVAAAKTGHSVILCEKNDRLCKKLFITGKGRCNVTNACETEDLFRAVISNPKFLYSAFYSFDSNAVMEFFEKAGCPLKVERGDRVFPVSDHSSDIIKSLTKELAESGVTVMPNTRVLKLLSEEKTVRGIVTENGRELLSDCVILATGGITYPLTGSTGDGHRMAEKAGITVTDCRGALVPLTVEEEWCKSLQGLALKNISLTLLKGEKTIYSDLGEMLFTHFGISGPLVLSASSYYVLHNKPVPKEKKEDFYLELDLKPALTMEQLDKRLLRDFEENKKKQFKNALNGLFPSRLIPVMIENSGIDPCKMVHEITKEERFGFAYYMKHIRLKISGTRGLAEAIITQGGIAIRQVNPSTMESRQMKGLYFAGEILDLDALTGGFNLQIAWATGHLAGISAGSED